MPTKLESALQRLTPPAGTREAMKMTKIWICSPINRKTSTWLPDKQVACAIPLSGDLRSPAMDSYLEFIALSCSCRFRSWQWFDNFAFRFSRVKHSSESFDSCALVSQSVLCNWAVRLTWRRLSLCSVTERLGSPGGGCSAVTCSGSQAGKLEKGFCVSSYLFFISAFKLYESIVVYPKNDLLVSGNILS